MHVRQEAVREKEPRAIVLLPDCFQNCPGKGGFQNGLFWESYFLERAFLEKSLFQHGPFWKIVSSRTRKQRNSQNGPFCKIGFYRTGRSMKYDFPEMPVLENTISQNSPFWNPPFQGSSGSSPGAGLWHEALFLPPPPAGPAQPSTRHARHAWQQLNQPHPNMKALFA